MAIICLEFAVNCYAANNNVLGSGAVHIVDSITKEAVLGIPTVVALTLNDVRKGDFYIFFTEAGDYFIKLSDLESLGVRKVEGQAVAIGGEDYVSITSVPGFTISFDEKKLAMEILAEPDLFVKQKINLLPARHKNVLRSNNNSAFLNYRLNHSGNKGFAGDNAFSLATEVGGRWSDYLFLSNFSHNYNKTNNSSVRLMSSITRDWRDDMTRLKIGDIFASSGDLGRTLNLGGIGFSKLYSIDPYLIRRPMAEISGAAYSPSEAEIYLDGMYIRKVKLSPGEFQLQNLNYYGGSKDIRVVIKDMFGREQEVNQDYYFTDLSLSKGLHEYSYNLGFVRQDFGYVSNHYSKLSTSVFHRYGFSDYFTLGVRGESVGGDYNAGLMATARSNQLGTVSAAMSASNTSVGNGLAAQLGYNYQKGAFSTGFLLRRLPENYTTINDARLENVQSKMDVNLRLGYGTKDAGYFGIDYNNTTQYGGGNRHSTNFTYSKSLLNNLYVFGSLSHLSGRSSVGDEQPSFNENNLYVGLAWSFVDKTRLKASYRESGDSSVDTLQISKNAPRGEGWGYRVNAENSRSNGDSTDSFDSYLQYNGSKGVYIADYHTTKNGGAYQLSAAGALSYVGGDFNFSRPIHDSFGLVQVGDIEGVRVLHNNQVVDKTNASGNAFIPNMSSYLDNQISINDKDVPIEYELKNKQQFVSPPLRSGSVIKFEANRIHAFTGRLKIRTDATTIFPVENNEFTLTFKGSEDGNHTAIPTVKDGEFYLENIRHGDFKGEFVYQGGSCIFDLRIPESNESIVDLGGIVCEQMH